VRQIKKILLALAFFVSGGISLLGCAHSIVPPQIQIAEKIVEAPDGIQMSFNGQGCHATNWSEGFKAMGKMIRKEPIRSNAGNCDLNTNIEQSNQREPTREKQQTLTKEGKANESRQNSNSH
jgi:hypothetical protein